MSDSPSNVALADRALALGAEGMSEREMAAAFGLTLGALAARRGEDADFDEAMTRAEEASRAWWEGLPRAALAEGRRFDHLSWREAMRARFGDAEAQAQAHADLGMRTSFVIPCNGRLRDPDGRCPYAAQDTSGWPDWVFAGHEPHRCHADPDHEDAVDDGRPLAAPPPRAGDFG